MNLKTAKIRICHLDLKGCVYLNHFSHSHAVANFFKRISRLGDGIFWYTMLALTWLLQGLVYSLQIVYLVLGSLCGTLIYKVLKIKTIRPRPYQVHQVIRMGERPLDHFQFSFRSYFTCGDGQYVIGLCTANFIGAHVAFYCFGCCVTHDFRATLSK